MFKMADEGGGSSEVSSSCKLLQHRGTRRKTPASSKKRTQTRTSTVEELLQQLDCLTESYKPLTKSHASRKQRAKHIFRYGSMDNKTGRRKVHCPRKSVTNNRLSASEKHGGCSHENLDLPAEDQLHFDDMELGSIDEANSDGENDLYNILQSCNPLIAAMESKTAKGNQKRTWYQRTESSLTRWESVREEVVKASIISQQISDNSMCSMCYERQSVIICKQCRKYRNLCCICDDIIHSSSPLHDRQLYADNQLQNLVPCQGITEERNIIDMIRYPVLSLPSSCNNCCCRGQWAKVNSNQECIVVTTSGRFDLFKFTIECLNCGMTIDPFKDISGIITSRYWPGTVDTVTYLFDEDLFQCWNNYHLWMPGSSEHAFIQSLQDISAVNGRVAHIQKEAFSQAFKEYKYLQYELNAVRKIDPFSCPPCHISQHAAMFDGNMKMYRYKSAGRRMRQSYYEEKFICSNELVNDLIKEVYKGSRSKYKEDDESLCGSSRWQAARNTFQSGGTRDETGLELVSCRHCVAQKAVNMFRGEIFGYAYFLQKNYKSNAKFYFSDVACRYWKWLSKIDHELSVRQIPAIGMLHVKGHPPSCEVLYGGMWKEGSGYTVGEEDEQIFSYLSRTGVTTKHMRPEYREESITEFAMFWNRRKVDKLAELLQKRLTMVKAKLKLLKEEFRRKASDLNSGVTDRMLAEWKSSVIAHAQVTQNTSISFEISHVEEYILLAIALNDLQKIPQEEAYAISIQGVNQLSLKSLKLRILSKPIETLKERFIALNRKLLAARECDNNSAFDEEGAMVNLKEKVLIAQQRQIEALFYSNLHISQNIGRLTDTCKKRRQLRFKVARQKEELRKLVQEYNSNVHLNDGLESFPAVEISSVSCGNFPWQKQQMSNGEVNSQLKQAMLITAMSIKRLQEEKSIMAEEMKNYLKFYIDINIPDLQQDIIKLQESETDCLCQKMNEDDAAAVTELCNSCTLIRGKKSLVLQGISYCVEQVRRGQRWFSNTLNPDSLECLCEDSADFLRGYADSQSRDDNEDLEDQSGDIEEHQDENTVAVMEMLSGLGVETPTLKHRQDDGVFLALFPVEISQSTFKGRNGSNACMLIDMLFANTFKQLSYEIDDTSELSNKMIALIYSSIHCGNRMYDYYYDSGVNSSLLNIDEACDYLLKEDVMPIIERVMDVFPESQSTGSILERTIEVAREESRYVNILRIVQGKSTIFAIDPNGGIFFMDSHRHETEGLLVCWTRTKSFQDMMNVMIPFFDDRNSHANVAIVSF